MRKIYCQSNYRFGPLRGIQLLLLLILATIVIYQSAVTFPASAQDATNSLVQQDFNNDNIPDVTTIAASFASPRDRVTVYDTNGDMQWSEDWEIATDFNDDIWIFDSGANGTAELIIFFSKNETEVLAALFMDLNGDGDVSYDFENNKPVVTESVFPPITAIADGDWYLPTGLLNWNVRFLIDGDDLFFGDRHPYVAEFQWRAGLVFGGYFVLDGIPDVEHRFYDYDNDGIGEASIWQALDDDLRSNGAGSRTWIWRNTRSRGTTITPTVVFWPFLGSANDPNIGNRRTLSYFDIQPFIPVQWALATVHTPAWIGYPIEEGFHVHSYSPLLDNEISYIAFENIQAYYDLAQDNDNEPELHIRHVYTDPEYDRVNEFRLRTPLNEMRYSWNLANSSNIRWDYKLGLIGRNLIEGQMTVGDYIYSTIPHEDLPYWVTEQEWDILTLIVAEENAYSSSEGIYEWSANQTIGNYQVMLGYVDGQYALDVSLLYQIQDRSITNADLPAGFRGELAADVFMSPLLYFSPIDRRLHLYNATYGLYATGPNSRVQYEDNNADGFMDTWTLFNNNDIFALLASTGTHLIYSDRGRTIIREVDLPPYIFTTLPPRNHEEWQNIREQVATYEQDFELQDFNAMLNLYTGPQYQITGGRISRFRYTENGWRFEIIVERTTRIVEDTLNLNVPTLEVGRYLIEYDSVRGISIKNLEPPDIIISLDDPQFDNLVTGQSFFLEITLENKGGQDLPNPQISGVGINEDGEEFPLNIFDVPSNINSGEETHVTLYWAPNDGGIWQFVFYVTSEDPELVGRSFKLQSAFKVNIQSLEAVSRLSYWDLENTIPYDGLTLVLLIFSLSFLAMLTGVLLLNYGGMASS